MKNNNGAIEGKVESKEKNRKEKSIPVRVSREMNDEIERLVCEGGYGTKSELIRELIRDGLNYRSKPQPYLPAEIQGKLLALLACGTKVLCCDEDGQIVVSESGVGKLKKLLSKRVRGDTARDCFALISVVAFLIALMYALAAICGN